MGVEICLHFGYKQVSHERLKSIKKMLAGALCYNAAVCCSKMLPRMLFKIPSATTASFSTELMVSLDVLKGAYVLCVSGIGCPKSLSFILEKVMFSFKGHFLIFLENQEFVLLHSR